MDFECDIGFKRSSSGVCESIKENNKPVEAPEICEGYYTVSQGYRKVPGNTCFGGDSFEPLKISCPGGLKIFSIKTGFIILILAGLGYFVT